MSQPARIYAVLPPGIRAVLLPDGVRVFNIALPEGEPYLDLVGSFRRPPEAQAEVDPCIAMSAP